MDFVPQITTVFENIPRELVLVFKTNDLLRGLDARLKTSAASASFISMSKCCLQAVYEDEYKKCDGLVSKCKLYGSFRWNMLRLLVYQISLSERLSLRAVVEDVVGFTVGSVVETLKWINDLPKMLVQN